MTDKAATGLSLSTASSWVTGTGNTPPLAGDIARWTSSSGPATGTFTGGLNILGILMEGALGDVFWNPGTAGTAITFNGTTNAFVQTTTNNRVFSAGANGQLALGTGNRTFTLWNSTGNWSLYISANRLTGSGTLTIKSADPTNTSVRPYMGGNNVTFAAFTGNIVMETRTGLGTGFANNATFPNSNITVAGDDCWLFPLDDTADGLGSATRTLTINSSNVILGYPARGWTIFYVVALGSTKRTLDIIGYTELSSNVTGTNGFIKTGTQALFVQASSTLSGQIVIDNGALALGTYNSTGPNVLPSLTDGFDFSATASAAFLRYYGNSAFTENRPMTVSGTPSLCHLSAQLNNTITFGPASLISSYPGIIQLVGDETITAPAMSFGTNVPATAAAFQGHTYNTTAGNRTYRFTLAPTSPVTLQGYIDLWSSNSISGHTLDIQNNGTAATTFSNATAVQKRAGASGASSSQAVTFSGSSPATTTLQGNILQDAGQGTLSLVKNFPGRLVLQGTNALSGSLVVSTGVFEAQNVAGLGAVTAASVSTSGTGQIELTAGGTYNKSGTNFTIHATNPIVSVGDNVLQTLGITLSGTAAFTVDAGNKLTISPQGAGVISGAFGITKNGDGELELTAAANSFTGQVTVNAGTLTIGSVANGLGQATWGTGALAPIVEVSGTLKYTGVTARTTRSVRLNGSSPKLDASGTGDVTFATASLGTGTKTITLQGSNTDPNTIESTILDSSGTTTLVKDGAGKWVLQGSLSYTGTTTVTAGTLRIETANSNTTSGAVTIGANGTVEMVTDGTVPTAGNGRVLGTSNVTVNGGTIKTRGGTTQKGQVRYGGNLTFTGNSTLYIGGAAAA